MTAYYNEIDPFAAAWLRELIKTGLIAPGVVDERDIRDVRPDELATFTQCHFFAGIGVWSHALRNAGWPDDRPVWTGSCPCQPFSAAGAGGGFADERHLWPHFHWLVEQCRPDTILGEQVASKDGLTWLDLVSSDLEGSGYAVGAVDTCSAGHGAPHIRQRLRFAAKRLDHAAGDIKLIHALFHSNCGGETMNAEDLWSKQEPYLRSTVDTFCRTEPHATWQRTFTRKEWLGYLERRFGVKSTDAVTADVLLNYNPTCRDIYLGSTKPLVPLKHVREDLKLKSTFFTVTTTGDQVVLNGRGFGHGVGLCQEGAMHMARQGKNYSDILRHYYTDVHLVDVNTLDFFRDDVKSTGMAGPKS